MLLTITLTIQFTELNIRERRLKIHFLKTTSKGFRHKLMRHRDTLTGPLILKNSLNIPLYAVCKRRIDSDLKPWLGLIFDNMES